MNWYSGLLRNESAMQPCHPAMPTPLFTASSNPFSCSRVIALIVHMGTIRSSALIFAVSRYTSSVVTTSTSYPCSRKKGAKRAAPFSGSWPSHPPQVIKADFIDLPSLSFLIKDLVSQFSSFFTLHLLLRSGTQTEQANSTCLFKLGMPACLHARFISK